MTMKHFILSALGSCVMITAASQALAQQGLLWNQLAACDTQVIAPLAGLSSQEFVEIVNAEDAEANRRIDALPDVEIIGAIEKVRLIYPATEGAGSSELDSDLYRVGPFWVFPVAPQDGYDNFQGMVL